MEEDTIKKLLNKQEKILRSEGEGTGLFIGFLLGILTTSFVLWYFVHVIL